MTEVIYAAITMDDASKDPDVSLHEREDDAKSAVVNELHELYGHIFNDDPPPDEYDPDVISQWCSDNMVKFTWAVRSKIVRKGA